MGFRGNENYVRRGMDTKQLMEHLKNKAVEVFNSDNWMKFLSFNSKFNQYSYRNRLLIFSQYPNATHLAPAGVWIQMGYGPKSGAKGINIFSKPFSVKEVVKDDSGFEEEVESGRIFRVETVFDISQICVWNEKKAAENPLDKFICKEIQGNDAEDIYHYYKSIETIPVVEKILHEKMATSALRLATCISV